MHNKLESSKKELLNLHNVLKTINCKFKDQLNLLAYTPTKQNNLPNIFKMTAQVEGELNFKARLILTESRQAILDNLEEEICNLQISIGLFVNEFFYRKDETVKLYNETRNKETDPFYKKRILYHDCPYNTAKKYYENFMIYDMFMTQTEDRIEELQTIIKIFEKYNESSVIAKTSNIFLKLAEEKNRIELSKKIIKDTRQDDKKAQDNLLNYFQNHPPQPNVYAEVNRIKELLHNRFKSTMNSRTQGKKYEKIKVNEPDKKPDDDDREIPRIFFYDASYHSKFASESKSAAPKNGQAALNYSWKVTHHSRLGISEGEFVVLMFTKYLPTGGSQWHGYAIQWDDLIKKNSMSRIIGQLQRMRIISGNGKIL